MEWFFSNVSYHGELEKKAMMEKKRSEPGEEDDATGSYIMNNFMKYFYIIY